MSWALNRHESRLRLHHSQAYGRDVWHQAVTLNWLTCPQCGLLHTLSVLCVLSNTVDMSFASLWWLGTGLANGRQILFSALSRLPFPFRQAQSVEKTWFSVFQGHAVEGLGVQ
jgi:hypothetical protein